MLSTGSIKVLVHQCLAHDRVITIANVVFDMQVEPGMCWMANSM